MPNAARMYDYFLGGSHHVAVAIGQAILRGDPAAVMIEGDLRNPTDILGRPQARQLLRLDQPLGVLLLAALHFVDDDATATGIVGTLRAAVAPGSAIAISHATEDHLPPPSQERLYARANQPLTPRSRQQIAQLFDGLDLVTPGLVFAPLWQPEEPDDLLLDQPERSAVYAGLGRKP